MAKNGMSGIYDDDAVKLKRSAEYSALSQFIKAPEFIAEKRSPSTNIGDIRLKRGYIIPDANIGEFFTLLEKCRVAGLPLSFTERQETDKIEHSGIMIDFDCFQNTVERAISDAQFRAILRKVSSFLLANLEIDVKPDEEFAFHAFIIMKPEVRPVVSKQYGNCFKDGFHILIPEIQVMKVFKRYMIDTLKKSAMDSIFKRLPIMGEPGDVLDIGSARNPVLFYGNSKVGAPPYKLVMTYKVGYSREDNSFSFASIEPPAGCNLCLELSLGYAGKWLKKAPYRAIMTLETTLQRMFERQDLIIEDDEASDDPRERYLNDLLDLLDIKYATDYTLWFKVLCAIAHEGSKYESAARRFSMRAPEVFSEDSFSKKWYEACACKSKSPITIGSIRYWASESSPEKFAELGRTSAIGILSIDTFANDGKIEHATVARVLHSVLGDKYVSDTADDKHYSWYEFVKPPQAMIKGEIYKWRREANPDNLHICMADYLKVIYSEELNYINNKITSSEDEEMQKYYKFVRTGLKTSMIKLGNDTYQNGVIKQACYRFRKRGFIRELDMDENILGVGNGVLKIGNDTQLIRGHHEYLVSKYTEVDYEKYDANNPQVRELLAAFRDVFPEPDVFEFMMMHAATGLDAREPACLLVMLVGGGRNGKSFFAKMVHGALGDQYCASGKATLITAGMEAAEAANSAQMQMRGKRYFYIDEFNKREKINPARIKTIVSPQKQSGRDLYEKQSNFCNKCNVILLSNFDFIVDTTDYGTWRRIYYYVNKIKFCENPTGPFEKKDNPRLILDYANDPIYQQAMLSIMTHYYEKLNREYGGNLKNVPVPTIMRETEEFRNKQDHINRFITCELIPDASALPIKLSDIANRYIEWYKSGVSASIKHDVSDIMTSLENSKIAQYISRADNLVISVVGVRYREPSESMNVNSWSSLNRIPSQADAEECEVPADTPAAEDENIDEIEEDDFVCSEKMLHTQRDRGFITPLAGDTEINIE